MLYRKDAESLNATSLAVIAGMKNDFWIWIVGWIVFLLRCVWRRISPPPPDLLLGSLAVFYYQDAFIFASAWRTFYIWKDLSCYLASPRITSWWQAFLCVAQSLENWEETQSDYFMGNKFMGEWIRSRSALCDEVILWGNKFMGERIWSLQGYHACVTLCWFPSLLSFDQCWCR